MLNNDVYQLEKESFNGNLFIVKVAFGIVRQNTILNVTGFAKTN